MNVELLIEPLQYNFMQRALFVAILVGIICALVGSYLMVQRLSLLGDVISHSMLPGLAIAFMLGINLYLGAFIAGILSTLIIAGVKARSPLKEDAAMGIVFSAFFAFGIILITIVQKDNQIDLFHFLFGNLLGVTAEEVRATAILTLIATLLIILFYKELLFYTFDYEGAQAVGLPINVLNFGLMLLIAGAIVASLNTVGVILVIALLITPSATAYLLVKRLHWVMILGAIIGVISSIAGMYISYYFNLPSGPAIVMIAISFFTLAFCFSPQHGILIPSQSREQPKA
ncbi:MAG: metal ABC transporter permease [Halothece sp.]